MAKRSFLSLKRHVKNQRRGSIDVSGGCEVTGSTPIGLTILSDVNESTKKLPTAEEVRRLFHYDPETGVLTWKIRRQSIKINDEVGKGHVIGSSGYRRVRINTVLYQAHKVIWLYLYGKWSFNQIDHINHNKSDNRQVNLREVTDQQSKKNRPLYKKNKYGAHGIRYRRGKYYVGITIDKKQIHIGVFDTVEDAVAARHAAEKKYGFHENHGKKNVAW